MLAPNVFFKIIELLKKEYPKWNAPVVVFQALGGSDSYKILISTILSARTKDEVTAGAVNRLFEKTKTPGEMSELSLREIESLIYPAGFYHNKARHLKEVSRVLIEQFDSKVPQTMEALVSLPGVGRKTANLVLSLAFGIPSICVDTHVHRICNRLLFVKTENPEETEYALRKQLPKRYWSDINTLLVAFGQTVCKPVSPKCPVCPVYPYCLYPMKKPKKKVETSLKVDLQLLNEK